MAYKKYYVKFETKEDFDKHFNKVYQEGRSQGFNDGMIWVLSYVQELFGDMFKPEAFDDANREIRTRQIERWRLDNEARSLKQELDYKNFMRNTLKELEENKDRLF